VIEDRRNTPSQKLVASTLQNIQVLVKTDPWQILIPMKGTRLDSTHIATTMTRPGDDRTPYNHNQFATILKENSLYALQTNFEDEEIEQSPLTPAVLDSKTETTSGWEFVFRTQS